MTSYQNWIKSPNTVSQPHMPFMMVSVLPKEFIPYITVRIQVILLKLGVLFSHSIVRFDANIEWNRLINSPSPIIPNMMPFVLTINIISCKSVKAWDIFTKLSGNMSFGIRLFYTKNIWYLWLSAHSPHIRNIVISVLSFNIIPYKAVKAWDISIKLDGNISLGIKLFRATNYWYQYAYAPLVCV